MKLYAQSQVPVRQPYTHLGYIAARSSENQLAGFVMVVISVLVLYYKVQHRTLSRGTGLLLGAIGIAGAIVFLVPGSRYARPDLMSKMRAHNVYNRILYLQEQKSAVPTTSTEVLRGSHAEPSDARDAWGREFRIQPYREGDRTLYRVISAGADGKFDTKDDINYPKSD